MQMTHRQKVKIICFSVQDKCRAQNSFKIIVLACIASTRYIQGKRDPERGLGALEACMEKRGM